MLSLKFIAVWLPLSYAMPFLSCAQSAPKSGCIDSGAIRGQQTVDWDTVERRCLEELATTKGQANQQLVVHRIYLSLADLYEMQHRFTDAEQYFQSAYDLAKSVFGERSGHVVRPLYGLGSTRLQLGHSREADVYFHQLLSILESDANANRMDIAAVLNNLAAVQHMTGNFSKAATLMRKVVHIFKTDPAAEAVDLGAALSNLATMLRDVGNRPEAFSAAERAASILECCKNTDHFAVNLAIQGLLHSDQGDIAGAEAMLLRALSTIDGLSKQGSPSQAIILTHLGALYLRNGKHSEAEPHFQRAVEINRRLLAPDHPRLLESMGAYATLLRATKRKSEAKKLEAYINEQREKYRAKNPAEANVVDVHSLLKQKAH